MKKRIKIRIFGNYGGGEAIVDAYQVSEHWATHRPQGNLGPSTTGWTVSHIEAGLAATTYDRIKQAQCLAAALECIPCDFNDAAQAKAWGAWAKIAIYRGRYEARDCNGCLGYLPDEAPWQAYQGLDRLNRFDALVSIMGGHIDAGNANDVRQRIAGGGYKIHTDTLRRDDMRL